MADLTTILIDQKEELGEMETGGLVPRKEEELVNLKSNVAQVVIGVRRSGKSTVCKRVILQSGLPFGYINFDDERLDGIDAEGLDELLKTLYRINGEFRILFLDEAQNVKGWHKFVNRK